MGIDASEYDPHSPILFVFIGSNHKNPQLGTQEYADELTISASLSPNIATYLHQVRDEIRMNLDSVIWQSKKASELKMNENLVRGHEFGGNDPRARYMPSIYRFTGRFFNEGGLGQEGISSLLQSGHHALIVDGLHGVTIPAEPIQLFNCPLEIESLEIQKRWRDQNTLTKILLDYIQKNSIQRVFDLTARRFYRDLIDWYEIKKNGIDVAHLFFEEYSGNDSLPEFAKICRERLFKATDHELLEIESDSVYETMDGNYIFSTHSLPPKGWAIESPGIDSNFEYSSDPAAICIALNEMIDNFERDMRDFLDKELSSRKKNWLAVLSEEPFTADIFGRRDDYLRKYPMLDKNDENVLDFCTINDYRKIIKKFWQDVFEPVIRSRSELEKHLSNVNELRNTIKHNRQIMVSTKKLGEGSLVWFNDIFQKYKY